MLKKTECVFPCVCSVCGVSCKKNLQRHLNMIKSRSLSWLCLKSDVQMFIGSLLADDAVMRFLLLDDVFR